MKYKGLVKEYHISGYLTEIADTIFNELKEAARAIIRGSAGIGKTYWVVNYLLPQVKLEGKELVLALPNVENLNQLLEGYGRKLNICILKEKQSYKPGADIYVSTPDSLDKIPLELLENSYLVADEYHTSVIESNFRKTAYNKLDVAEKVAYKTIVMTATDECFFNDEFDLNIKVDSEMRIKVGELKILNYPSIPGDAKLALIKALMQKHDLLLVVNDDIDFNNEMKEYLTKQGVTGVYTYSSKERDTDEIKYLRRHRELPGHVKVLISTSAINSGIDINNVCNFATLAFWKDYSFQKDVQFKARNRRGTHTMYNVFCNSKEEEPTELKPLKKLQVDYFNALDGIKERFNFLLSKDEDEELIGTRSVDGVYYSVEDSAFKVDMRVVKRKALDEYNKNLAKNPDVLGFQLSKNLTFRIEKVTVEWFEEPPTDNDFKQALIEKRKELKEIKEAQNQAFIKDLLVIESCIVAQLEDIRDEPDDGPEEICGLVRDYSCDERHFLIKDPYLVYQWLYDEDFDITYANELFKIDFFAKQNTSGKVPAVLHRTIEQIKANGEDILPKIATICHQYNITKKYGEAVHLFVQKLKEELAVQQTVSKIEKDDKYYEELFLERAQHNADDFVFVSAKNLEEIVDAITLKARGKILNKIIEDQYNLSNPRKRRELQKNDPIKQIREKMWGLDIGYKARKEYIVEEALIYHLHLSRGNRLTEARLFNLWIDLCNCGFMINDLKQKEQNSRKKLAKQQQRWADKEKEANELIASGEKEKIALGKRYLREIKKSKENAQAKCNTKIEATDMLCTSIEDLKNPNIVTKNKVPTIAKQELLRKIEMLFNLSVNKISSVNI